MAAANVQRALAGSLVTSDFLKSAMLTIRGAVWRFVSIHKYGGYQVGEVRAQDYGKWSIVNHRDTRIGLINGR